MKISSYNYLVKLFIVECYRKYSFVIIFFSIGKFLAKLSNDVLINAKLSKNLNPLYSNAIMRSLFCGMILIFLISSTDIIYNNVLSKKCESYPLQLCAKTGVCNFFKYVAKLQLLHDAPLYSPVM